MYFGSSSEPEVCNERVCVRIKKIVTSGDRDSSADMADGILNDLFYYQQESGEKCNTKMTKKNAL